MSSDATRPWFGPHLLGWGWSPASPEGWVVTAAVALIGIVAARVLIRHAFAQFVVLAVSTAAVVVLAMATGTRPGSRLMGDTVESARLERP